MRDSVEGGREKISSNRTVEKFFMKMNVYKPVPFVFRGKLNTQKCA